MPYKIPKASEYFLEYKQFQNEYFKKLSFVAITFTKLEKLNERSVNKLHKMCLEFSKEV